MAKFVTLHAILQKLVEAARNKPETTGKLVTFILKNEKKLKPLVSTTANAAGQLIAATEILKKVNKATGDNMNKFDKFTFDNASKAISILQDATSITNLLTGGKTKSGAGKFFRQAEKFVNPGQIILEQVKGKINMANKIRNRLFGPNDLSWYSHYPELNQAMIGPNFYNIVGSKLQLSNKAELNYSVPLGMSFDILLTIPTSVNRILYANNAINLDADTSVFDNAINKIYASIRRANTGAINYSPKDLKLFIINFRSVLAEYVMFGRVYGTINKYKLLNRSVPGLFFRMMNISAAKQPSYENNAADLYNKLTQWRIRLNSVCPIYLDLFKRTEWLFTGYWKDDDSSKAQYFAFNTRRLPKYDYSKTDDQAAIAEWAMKDGLDVDFTTACNNMEADINNLANHPTNVIIAGDMLRAFKDAGLKQYLLPTYPMNYESPEAYDEEALTIIQNSSTIPWDYTTGDAKLWWNGGDQFITKISVVQNSTDSFAGTGPESGYKYINAYKGVRKVVNDNKVTLAITRFVTTYRNETSSTDGKHCCVGDMIGTEVVMRSSIYYNDNTGTLCTVRHYDFKDYDLTANPQEYFLLNYLWAGIDWAPMMRTRVSVAVNDHVTKFYPSPLFDWEMYAQVTSSQLSNYNDIVTMNLLYAPDVMRPNKVELLVTTKTSNDSSKGKKDKNK